MKKELFRIFNLSVCQQHHTLLSNLYLQVFAGEHTGILFNSFSEQTAFLNFLDGTLPITSGKIYFEEHSITYPEFTRCCSKKIAIILESSRLMDRLSIYENLFYEQLTFSWLTASKYKKMALTLLEKFSLSIDVEQKVTTLNNFERIAIELMKAFSQKKKLIFLSNVASLLSPEEFKQLLRLLRKLESYDITFLIGETFHIQLFQMATSLYLVKNGQIIRVLSKQQITQAEIQKSLGSYKFLHQQNSNYSEQKPTRTILEFCNVSDSLFNDLSFSLNHGELLKILCSNNQEIAHLLHLLRGESSPDRGHVLFCEKPLSSYSMSYYKKCLGVIESNPRQTMIFHNMTVLYNLCVPLDSKKWGFWTNSCNLRSVKYTIKDLIPDSFLSMNIDTAPIEIIQKVIYGRWLLYAPDLLICINPFSIIDTALNVITQKMLRLLTEKGVAVLIISNNWSIDTELEGKTLLLPLHPSTSTLL